MSYIGQTLPADTFQGFVTDKFTGDGTANKTFTLSKTPFNESAILVTIDGVVQEATDDFTVSGTTLTLVGTAPNGSEVNAIHIGGALPIGQAASLDLNGASDQLILDADADTTISADTDDQIDFKAGGTDIMSLTATTATFNDGVTITTADNTDQLTLISTDADANAGPKIAFTRTSSSPADNDIVGQFSFTAQNDAGEATDYCRFRVHLTDVSDGTEDGNFRLFTLNGGAENSRIDIDATETAINEDSADLDFRVETNSNAYGLFVDAGNDAVMIGGVGSSSGTTDHRLVLFDFGQINVFRQGANSLRSAVIFYNADSGSNIGSITMQSSATAFNTSSDYRLKENVDYDWDATTTLKQLKPAKFNWIADDTNTLLEGFIAHEVSSVVPQAIVGEKDKVATAEDVAAGFGGAVGDPIYQGIDQSKLVPLMVKTIQELEARIKTLEDA